MRPVALVDFTQSVKLGSLCWQMDTQKELGGQSAKSGLIYNCEHNNISQILSLSHPIVEVFCFCTFSVNINFS